MDQSSSVITHADAALYITFFPSLNAEPIPLPITAPRSVFVCANSLVVSDKVVHARTRYNLRFFEISVAARVLAHQLGVSVGAKERVSMREVVGRWAGENVAEKDLEPHLLKKALEELGGKIDGMKLVESDGEDGAEVGVTLEEMIRLSGMTEDDFRDVYMSNVDGAYAVLPSSIHYALIKYFLQLKQPISNYTSARSTFWQRHGASSSFATSAFELRT